MNERYIVKNLIALAKEEGVKNNYSKITGIYIRLGAHEEVHDTAILEIFNEYRDDPMIKEANLLIKKNKPLARCRYCGCIFEVFYFNNKCKQCGNTYLEFIVDSGICLEKIEGQS